MDPAILILTAACGGLFAGGYAFRARYLANLPLQVSRLVIRRQRGPDTSLLFRVRLGRGRRADGSRATVRFSAGPLDETVVEVAGPADRVVGPWTFTVPLPTPCTAYEGLVAAEVHVKEGDREWFAHQTWTQDQIRVGSYRSLHNLPIRIGVIDRPDWEEVIDISADHVLAESRATAIL